MSDIIIICIIFHIQEGNLYENSGACFNLTSKLCKLCPLKSIITFIHNKSIYLLIKYPSLWKILYMWVHNKNTYEQRLCVCTSLDIHSMSTHAQKDSSKY